MATRFIQGNLDLDTLTSGDTIPFGVEDDGALAIRRGPTWKGANSSDPGVERIPVSRVINLTASATLTAADHGALIIADSTTSVVAQLPATQKGLRYTLLVKQLTGAGGHAFSPNASDKIMGVTTQAGSATFAKADDADLVCSAATDVVGNFVTLVGDGVDGWWVTGISGTWA
jgi:hypothetical protein